MKFRLKVALCIISVVALLFGVGASMMLYRNFEISMDSARAASENLFINMMNGLYMVNESGAWDDADDMTETVKRIVENDSFFSGYELFDENLKIYYATGVTHFDVDSGDVNLAELGVCEFFQTQSHDGDKKYYVSRGGIEAGGQRFCLYAYYDVTPIFDQIEEQEKTYVFIYVLVVLLCAVISYILGYFLTRPITHLSKVATKISKGNYDIRSNIRSDDEIGKLSKNFDSMTDALVHQMNELEAAMERQNQFIGDFTHELKTPLTSVIGYADLLRSHSLTGEDYDTAIGYIFSEGKRLEHLSIKMLNIIVAQKDDFELVSFSPKSVIEGICATLESDYRKQGIFFSLECDEGNCNLEPDFIHSLIRNLLENARRAMPGGGVIKITSKMTENGCNITVADNGCGIPKEALPHIQEAFYRVDKARSRSNGGAGLGLSLCKLIAEIHNGTIEIDSAEGVGTTVSVNLNGGR